MFPESRARVEGRSPDLLHPGGRGARRRPLNYGDAVSGSRRITVAVGVLMFVDASLYLAVLPLLPTTCTGST